MKLVFTEPVLSSTPYETTIEDISRVEITNKEIRVYIDGGGWWVIADVEPVKHLLNITINGDVYHALTGILGSLAIPWQYFGVRIVE